ncbi:hypothetical protein HQ47_05920 [Porphyromonas macacae]|uniref:Uncharacterized protein n=1 Tax=Porphyromonas macacae TaxID=28115 RepID=A0A0A2ECN1_9PORP|nr:hypothetical protein HQ47_05920 [Porphyromonas macacae]
MMLFLAFIIALSVFTGIEVRFKFPFYSLRSLAIIIYVAGNKKHPLKIKFQRVTVFLVFFNLR